MNIQRNKLTIKVFLNIKQLQQTISSQYQMRFYKATHNPEIMKSFPLKKYFFFMKVRPDNFKLKLETSVAHLWLNKWYACISNERVFNIMHFQLGASFNIMINEKVYSQFSTTEQNRSAPVILVKHCSWICSLILNKGVISAIYALQYISWLLIHLQPTETPSILFSITVKLSSVERLKRYGSSILPRLLPDLDSFSVSCLSPV